MRHAVLVLCALIAGCAHAAPPANAERTGPPARVDVAVALVRHPFAPIVAQYDRDIATLRAAAGTAAFAGLDARLAAAAAGVDIALRDAAVRLRSVRNAPRNLPPAPGAAPDDFGPQTLAAFEHASSSRVARAFELRGQQLRETEANVAYAFDRTHASRRMLLRLKLRNLHLEAATSRAYRAELKTYGARERTLVDAQRQTDAKVLAAYAVTLRASAVANANALRRDLDAHQSALRAVPLPKAPHLPPALARGSSRDTGAFDTARTDLIARYGQLRTLHRTSRQGLADEITGLARERDALRAGMIVQIETRADRIAAAQGLGPVYASAPPPGARDLTAAVVDQLNAIAR